jgi:hypothetical protein
MTFRSHSARRLVAPTRRRLPVIKRDIGQTDTAPSLTKHTRTQSALERITLRIRIPLCSVASTNSGRTTGRTSGRTRGNSRFSPVTTYLHQGRQLLWCGKSHRIREVHSLKPNRLGRLAARGTSRTDCSRRTSRALDQAEGPAAHRVAKARRYSAPQIA